MPPRGCLGPELIPGSLALVLLVTAITLGGVSAYLIGRYVEDETVTFTQDAVAGHFGTVFQTSVFQRPLTQSELQTLEQNVVFHLSIYSVVATRFYTTDGTIVFSHDPGEIGRRLDLAVPSDRILAIHANARFRLRLVRAAASWPSWTRRHPPRSGTTRGARSSGVRDVAPVADPLGRRHIEVARDRIERSGVFGARPGE